MPRDTKPPRLWVRPARHAKNGRSAEKAVYIISYAGRQHSTGCGKDDRIGAQKALEAFLAEQHSIPKKRRDIEEIPVADVLNLYLQDIVPDLESSVKATARIERLMDWWGDKTLNEVTKMSCIRYAKTKSAGAARRELQDLSAAIGHHLAEGRHREVVKVTLPKAGSPRLRWLTRNEAATALKVCLHTAETQMDKNTKKRPIRHLARMILFGLYTGSRPADIFAANFHKPESRGYINLEEELFYRKAWTPPLTNAPEKKPQPTTPIPDRLLVHLKRWRSMGAKYVVEFEGKQISSPKKAFRSMLKLAQLAPGVVPYTLRHTFATWKLSEGVPTWNVAGLMGTSEQMIRKHYGHHDKKNLKKSVEAGTQRNPKKRRSQTVIIDDEIS